MSWCAPADNLKCVVHTAGFILLPSEWGPTWQPGHANTTYQHATLRPVPTEHALVSRHHLLLLSHVISEAPPSRGKSSIFGSCWHAFTCHSKLSGPHMGSTWPDVAPPRSVPSEVLCTCPWQEDCFSATVLHQSLQTPPPNPNLLTVSSFRSMPW